MTAPGEKIYMRRRHRRYGWIGSTLLVLVMAALVLTVVLFYALQRYIVYDADGLRLEVPLLMTEEEKAASLAAAAQTQAEAEAAASALPQVTANIVVDAEDWSAYESTAGESVTAARCLYVPADQIGAAGLDRYAVQATENGYDGLVLEMKGADGQLRWASGTELAISFGASGSFDVGSVTEQLHDSGLTLSALISCCADELLATRDPALALRSVTGSAYRDDADLWLDLYNSAVRDYVLALTEELYQLGFDQVILENLCLPDTDELLLYSTDMTLAPDRTDRVLKFSEALRALAEEYGGQLSIVYPADSREEYTGLALTSLPLFYDRVYYRCPTDMLNARRDTLSALAGEAWDEQRFVPILDRWTDSASFVLNA